MTNTLVHLDQFVVKTHRSSPACLGAMSRWLTMKPATLMPHAPTPMVRRTTAREGESST